MKNFYTELGQAVRLLQKRKHLKKKIEYYWDSKGFPVPKTISENTKMSSFLARHVASHKKEDQVFYETSKQHSLTPTWSEYTGDIFVSVSKPKIRLLHPIDKNGNKIKLVNPQIWEKKRICEIQDIHGNNIVKIHHSLWDNAFEDKDAERINMTSWLQKFGTAKDYYFADLSLCIAHGILFKDFHGTGKMSSKKSLEFTRSIVEPAFQKCIEVFEFNPLIYQFSYQEGFERTLGELPG